MLKTILKKLLSQEQIAVIKSRGLSAKVAALKLAARSPRISAIYYALFTSRFSRECRAVIWGKIRYIETHLSYELSTSALLRRNTHRLEKALIMRPRKPVFASAYIGETVKAYVGMMGSPMFCDEEKKWSSDVLKEYFDKVQDDARVAAARKQYNEFMANNGDANGVYDDATKYIPYPDHARANSQITQEQLNELFLQRRSTRWFDGRAVEEDKLDTAIKMASLAPSACNRQPFQFFVMNNNQVAAEVAAFAGGTGGFAKNIPCLIAVVGDLSAYPGEQDRHLIYIDGSLAAMQFMLALETLKLSSCPINWPDVEFRERKIEKRLNLNPSQRVIMLIAVGYADGDGKIPYSSKKTVAHLRKDIA